MNFRELHEDVGNFADQAETTLNNVGKLAKSAFGKFKDAHKKASQELDQESKAAALQKEKDEKAAAKQAELDRKTSLKAKAGPRSAPVTVAGIVLDRTPEAEDLPELEDLDAEHFAYVQNALDQVTMRFNKFSKALVKTFRTATYVNASDRNEIPDRLADQSDRMLDSGETMLMKNQYGERDAWMKALLNDDPEVGAKALVNMIGALSADHTRKNAAQNKKVYAEGLNLINLVGAQRQIIELRLNLMRDALDKLSQKPAMNEALLRRVSALKKRL
jgi:hypothetical protein